MDTWVIIDIKLFIMAQLSKCQLVNCWLIDYKCQRPNLISRPRPSKNHWGFLLVSVIKRCPLWQAQLYQT